MTPDDLLSLLGLPATQPEIMLALAEFGITASPSLPDVPPDEQAWFDWLINGRRGIEFGFQDQADLLAQDPQLRGKGPLLLTQICFYCQHPGIEPYDGPLPFRISVPDGKAQVRSKLLASGASGRSYIRDVWDLQGFRIIVAYTPDGGQVASVLCLLPIRPWPASDDEPEALPSVDQLIGVLGQAAESLVFRRTFVPLRLGTFGFDATRAGHWTLRHAYGFDLSFIEPLVIDVIPETHAVVPVLGSIRLHRDRDMDAYGWKGELPYGIRFDDSQTVLFEKLGHRPAVMQDRDLQGYAVWHFPNFTLHVLYSNLHNRLLRVTLMQPGLWESADEC
jgi:hypothetical protein